jgi:hypothetical protein
LWRFDPNTNHIDWMGGVAQNSVHELVVSKDGSRIFTNNIGSNPVSAIAPWDPAVDTQTYPKGHEPPPWGTIYMGVGDDNNAAVIDMKTLEVTGRIIIGEQSEGIAWVGK